MPGKILVVGPSWVGDMVMAQSLFISLKQKNPDVVIDVLAPGWSLPMLARMPEVRRSIDLPVAHGELGLAQLLRIGGELRREHYDRAIVIPRKFKAALVPWFARIPRRTGYRGEARYFLINDMRRLDKRLLTQTVQRFVALGEDRSDHVPAVPLPRLRVDETHRQQLLKHLELNLDSPAVAFMPGAEYGPSKQWPAEYFAQLAKALARKGRQVWILGSARDAAVAETICRESEGAAVNLCGQTQLADVVDLLSVCESAVSNDSGLMHVAAAVGIPLVALYGSTTPDFTPPLSQRADIICLRLDCSPCFQRECPLVHHNCLRQIRPEMVMERIMQRPAR